MNRFVTRSTRRCATVPSQRTTEHLLRPQTATEPLELPSLTATVPLPPTAMALLPPMSTELLLRLFAGRSLGNSVALSHLRLPGKSARVCLGNPAPANQV